MKISRSFVGDILIIALCALALLFIFTLTQRGGSGYLSVQTTEGLYRYSLATNQRFSVSGSLGETIIEINGGKARIIDSACLNKTCTFQAPIEKSGSFIACLPNHVLLTIVGEPSLEVDDVAH